jgi:hypothetical protein
VAKFGNPSGAGKSRKDALPSSSKGGPSADPKYSVTRFPSKTNSSAAGIKARLQVVRANPRLYNKKTEEFTLAGVAAISGLTAKQVDNIINKLAERMEESVLDHADISEFAEGAKTYDKVEEGASYYIDDRFEDASSYVIDELFEGVPASVFNDDALADALYPAAGAVAGKANLLASRSIAVSALEQDLAYQVSKKVDAKKSTDAGLQQVARELAKAHPKKYKHLADYSSVAEYARDFAED